MSGKPKKKIVAEKKSVPLPRKLKSMICEKMPPVDVKRLAMLNIPYVIVFYLVDKLAWLYRHCIGDSLIEKAMALFERHNYAGAKEKFGELKEKVI